MANLDGSKTSFDLIFLGTCACDYSPKLKTEFTDCFDLDARRSSAILMNGHFLIDCGFHALDSLRIAGIDLAKITDIFISHLHSDHFNAQHIGAIAAAKEAPLRLWVAAEAVLPEIANVEVQRMTRFNTYTVQDGVTVTGLSANHNPKAFPQHFLFEREGKKFLYACDGAWMMTETLNYLKKARLDLAILDATCGDYEGDYRMAEHNSIPMIRLMLPSLKTVEIIHPETEVYLSHLAPSLHKPHVETVEIVKQDGLKVAYDGLQIQI